MNRVLQMTAFTAALMGGAALVQHAVAQQGTTSGPAAGTQTTLGTGGQTTDTPAMSSQMRNKGGAAISAEKKGQKGGTAASVTPGVSGAESSSNGGAGQHAAAR